MGIIEKRRSVRAYREKKISRESLETLIKAGMAAPSARAQYIDRYLITEDPKKLALVAENIPAAGFAKAASAFILVLAEKRTGTTFNLFPCDLGAVTQNILLKATELGIGSCWIGLYKRTQYEAFLRELFNIPDDYIIYSGIVCGYPQNSAAFCEKNRFAPEHIAWEQY